MVYKPSVILQDFEKLKNLKDGEFLDKETSQRLLLVCDLPEHKEFVKRLIAMNKDVFVGIFNSIDDENNIYRNEHPLYDADGKYQ